MNPETVYGLGFILVALYMANKYGYLSRRLPIKFFIFFLSLGVVLIISTFAYRHFSASLNILAFMGLTVTVLLLGEWEWIQTFRNREKEFREKLEEIRGKMVDLEEIGFTPREIQVGRALVDFMETDKELAWRLGIAADTLKNHLKSMRRKAEVGTRTLLLEKIKWYYHYHDLLEAAGRGKGPVTGEESAVDADSGVEPATSHRAPGGTDRSKPRQKQVGPGRKLS